MTPHYADDNSTIYVGDCRGIGDNMNDTIKTAIAEYSTWILIGMYVLLTITWLIAKDRWRALYFLAATLISIAVLKMDKY